MTRPLPEDPIIRQLVLQARKTQISRRHMLQGAGVGAATLALAACTPAGSSAPTPAEDISATDKALTWSNWPAYIDEDDDGNYPTLQAFEQETGIKVSYVVDIDDNNTYYGTIKDQLALGQDTGADTMCLTEWMVARLIRFGYVQELDAANIPNKANLTEALLNPDFDPGRARSLPWQNGFAGLAWNTEELPSGLTSVQELWDPSLKGKVTVLSEMRDTIGILLLDAGIDISSTFSSDDYNAAIAVLEEQVVNGQVTIKGNEYMQDFVSGDAIAAIAWSGDITVLNYEAGYEKWKFALPEAGGTLWGDTFVVPMGSPRKKNAETLMNFYYEPEVAADVAAWVNFITPVEGAAEVAAEKYPELAENQLIFPNEATLAQSHIFRTLEPAEDQEFNAEFQRVALGA